MLTLYYGAGACSMASHIGLEESKAPYEAKPVMLPKGEQKTETYMKINPRGKVPALSVDGKIIVENTGILSYIAKQFPQANLMPKDPVDEARCISTMVWFSTIVHPSYQHFMRSERFAEGEAAQASVKELGRKAFWSNLQEIDGMLQGKDWIMGSQFTVADGYALVFYGWAKKAGLPVQELKAYTAFKNRMRERPAVRKILEREDSVLLKD